VVRVPGGTGNFSLHHRVQTGSGTHSASYPMGTKGSFLAVNLPECEADSTPPSSAEDNFTFNLPVACVTDIVLLKHAALFHKPAV